MNDLEFYKHCVSDLNSQDKAFKQEVNTNSQRRRIHQGCLEFDEELREAMSISPPPRLDINFSQIIIKTKLGKAYEDFLQ